MSPGSYILVMHGEFAEPSPAEPPGGTCTVVRTTLHWGHDTIEGFTHWAGVLQTYNGEGVWQWQDNSENDTETNFLAGGWVSGPTGEPAPSDPPWLDDAAGYLDATPRTAIPYGVNGTESMGPCSEAPTPGAVLTLGGSLDTEFFWGVFFTAGTCTYVMAPGSIEPPPGYIDAVCAATAANPFDESWTSVQSSGLHYGEAGYWDGIFSVATCTFVPIHGAPSGAELAAMNTAFGCD